jgi:fatty acid desaturase
MMLEGQAEGQAEEQEGRHPAWVVAAIRAGQRYHVRTKSPLRHNLTNLAALASVLAIMAVVAWASTQVPPTLYIPVAAVLFGWCYFAAFVLVVHEASHSMFLVGSNRKLARSLNRGFGWSVALPFAVHYGKHWEWGHHEHHVRPLEPADPQQYSISVGKPLLVRVLCNVFVPGFLFLERTIFRARRAGGKSSSSRGVILGFLGLWAVVLTAAAVTVGWPLAVSLFLGIHVLSAWNQVKGGLEHGGRIGREADSLFRSRTTLFPGRYLLMPFNITLHFEHHLNFCVPWYDLGRYHRDLQAIVPPPVWRDVINRRPIDQLAGQLGGLSDAARALSAPPSMIPPQERRSA